MPTSTGACVGFARFHILTVLLHPAMKTEFPSLLQQWSRTGAPTSGDAPRFAEELVKPALFLSSSKRWTCGERVRDKRVGL
jgi:hypothetical protein